MDNTFVTSDEEVKEYVPLSVYIIIAFACIVASIALKYGFNSYMINNVIQGNTVTNITASEGSALGPVVTGGSANFKGGIGVTGTSHNYDKADHDDDETNNFLLNENAKIREELVNTQQKLSSKHEPDTSQVGEYSSGGGEHYGDHPREDGKEEQGQESTRLRNELTDTLQKLQEYEQIFAELEAKKKNSDLQESNASTKHDQDSSQRAEGLSGGCDHPTSRSDMSTRPVHRDASPPLRRRDAAAAAAEMKRNVAAAAAEMKRNVAAAAAEMKRNDAPAAGAVLGNAAATAGAMLANSAAAAMQRNAAVAAAAAVQRNDAAAAVLRNAAAAETPRRHFLFY